MIQLNLTVTPATISSQQITEVRWQVSLSNPTAQAVVIHPDLAQFDGVAGWEGPFWQLKVLAQGQPESNLFRQLRHNFGPPPGLPPPAYYRRGELELKPQTKIDRSWTSCFIPQSKVPPEAWLAKEDDGDHDNLKSLEFDIQQAHFMVMRRSCPEVMAAIEKGEFRLRPSEVLLLPSLGTYQIQLSYWQPANIGRELPQVSSQSHSVTLTLK